MAEKNTYKKGTNSVFKLNRRKHTFYTILVKWTSMNSRQKKQTSIIVIITGSPKPIMVIIHLGPVKFTEGQPN